jgi:DNA-directed RNA polymerase specialized sigma24 family protein
LEIGSRKHLSTLMEHIFSRHKHWILIVKKFGEVNYAEDVVQEAYIKVMKLNKEVNEAYFYYTLRSLTMDLHSKKVIKVEITKDIEYLLREDDSNDIASELAQPYLEFIDTWHWYDKKLFMLWVNNNISMRKISRETKIKFTSVYNTIKKCKQRLKEWENDQLKERLL